MQRGAFMVGELIYYDFPADAGNMGMQLPADSGDFAFREQLGQLEEVPACNKCHRMINAGFAFDIFDTVGRRWPESAVGADDARGYFEIIPFPVFSFESTEEAISGVADHPALGRCYSAQILRFAQGTAPSDDDSELLCELESNFTATGGNVQNALRIIVSNSRFRAAAN